MRSSLINALIILLSIVLIWKIYQRINSTDLEEIPSSIIEKMESKLNEAKEFNIKQKLNKQYGVFIDMNIHSGKYRLFVLDLKKDSILKKALVSHGCGKLPWGRDWSKKKPKFSNTPESHLASLGKYKIGKRGFSNWGINVNYKLHGLDSTNSNAYDRIIVLHSWEAVKDKSVYPKGTPEGWGCPAVSNKTMKYLDSLFKANKDPLLLWVYE